MPKVSIVMPVLNGGAYFYEAINSAIGQTLDDIEIVVVDGGSTDGTIELVKNLQKNDGRIKLIYSDLKSAGHQCNLGIEKAIGEYIGFVEADDYVAEDMFEVLYKECTKYDLDYAKSDYVFFISEKEDFFLSANTLRDGLESLYGKIIVPSTKPQLIFSDLNLWNGLYKRSFLIENEIRQNNTPKAAYQDIGFVLQAIMKAKRAKYILASGYRYRQDNIASSVKNERALMYVVQEAEYAYEYAKEIIDSSLGVCILERFISLFFGQYETSILCGTDELFLYESAKRFQAFCYKWLSSTRNHLIESINIYSRTNLFTLLNDIDSLNAIETAYSRMICKQRKLFVDLVKKQTKSIIIDSNRWGRNCYAFLYNNGYRGVTCFCDNDPNRVGKETMSLPVLYPENAREKYEDSFYIIATDGEDYIRLHEQLIQLGVDECNICKGYIITEHVAFSVIVS